jgi:hypothetical protein
VVPPREGARRFAGAMAGRGMTGPDTRPLHIPKGAGKAALEWDLAEHPVVETALDFSDVPMPDVPAGEQAELAAMMAGLYREQERRNADGAGDGKGRRSAADRLVALAEERYDLGRADDGEPFAVERDGPNVAHLFRGGRASLRAALAADYATEAGKVPPAQSLVDALAVLEGRALAAPRQALPLRAVRLPDGAVLHDLADGSGRVARVDADGWTILPRSPVPFRRSELTGPLPTPAAGDLGRLGALLNVGPDDLSCALAQLVAAVLGIPAPIVLLRGPAGVAKTWGARILAATLDPSPAAVRAAPRDFEQWAVATSGSLVVALDNLDSVPAWLSDALCRAVTGEAIVRRLCTRTPGCPCSPSAAPSS